MDDICPGNVPTKIRTSIVATAMGVASKLLGVDPMRAAFCISSTDNRAIVLSNTTFTNGQEKVNVPANTSPYLFEASSWGDFVRGEVWGTCNSAGENVRIVEVVYISDNPMG